MLTQRLQTAGLHKDPEGLGSAMDLRIPLEVWSDRQLHHQTGASDGLHVGTQVQLWELVNQLVDGLACESSSWCRSK